MLKIGDRATMVVFAFVGLGTLAGILLTSQVKKVASGQTREAQAPGFDQRIAALDKKP